MRSFLSDKRIKLSRFLLDKYEGELSFSDFNKLLRKKDVKINGKRVGEDLFLQEGDAVDVYYDGRKREIDYTVKYFDENIVCAIKPKGIASEKFFAALKGVYEPLYFCHRLDVLTDGIMLFARNEDSYQIILNAFKGRKFEKYYLALVNGIFTKKQGVLSGYLKKDEINSIVTVFDVAYAGAKPIKTGYKVLSENAEKDISLVEIRLFTGRTHQIRAHLSHEGHFVLGDGKYGSEKINRIKGFKKLMLTSYKLVLRFDKESILGYLDGKEFVYNDCLLSSFITDI